MLLLLLLLSECLMILLVICGRVLHSVHSLHSLYLVQSGVPGRDFVAMIEQAQVVFADIGLRYVD